ncbi:hypothetical protein [Qipengyuania sp. MTN3-11]|uniref:hypothetical protein n=1 Tax=Qipengyuania sp. MTN3-11 TaxID=3056557 RepID=UPI0036F21468
MRRERRSIGGDFLIALVAAVLAGFGGRDQLLAAAIGERLGITKPLIGLALASSAATAILAAWFGGVIGSDLSDSAETMLVAIALLIVAAELVRWRPAILAREPTHSLGAMTVVLLARQIGDPPRLIVFALAAGGAVPMATGIGGAVATVAGMAVALAMGYDGLVRLPLATIRRVLSGLAFVAAIVIGLLARGLI